VAYGSAWSFPLLERVSADCGIAVDCPVGTMIEFPRAALTAGRIAKHAEFFSFGTNDLTQTTWGFSRDDVEAAFFSAYLDKGIFQTSPFETIDREGVGRLVRIAVTEGRAARPELKIGVCGEHGGDPGSVHLFHDAGLATSRAHPSACPSHAWKPDAPPCHRQTARTAAEPASSCGEGDRCLA